MTIETLRQPKILGFAIFDIVVSFLGIYLLAPILSKLILLIKVDVPRQNWLYLTLPIGIAVHMAVGNITPMTKSFLSLQGGYLIKILIIGLFILGLRGIKIVK